MYAVWSEQSGAQFAGHMDSMSVTIVSVMGLNLCMGTLLMESQRVAPGCKIQPHWLSLSASTPHWDEDMLSLAVSLTRFDYLLTMMMHYLIDQIMNYSLLAWKPV